MERPRARSGTGCSLVGPGRCGDSGEAGRAGRSRLATASAHGSVPAPISFRSDRQRDRSGAEFRVARAILHDVLQMEAPVAIAVPLEIGERVVTTHDHVADVELVA